jgi:hypothetical protein
MQQNRKRAMTRLVRLLDRRRTGNSLVEDDLLVERLREEFAETSSVDFSEVCTIIAETLNAGYTWDARWSRWRRPPTLRPPGRPARPCFLTGWEFARLEALKVLQREPSAPEIADFLRHNDDLRKTCRGQAL